MSASRRPSLTNGHRLARRSPAPTDKPAPTLTSLPPITGEARAYWSARKAVRASALLKANVGNPTASRYLRAVVKWRWSRVVTEMQRKEFADPYGVAASLPPTISSVTTVDQLAWHQPATYGVVLTGGGYTEASARRIERARVVLEGRYAEMVAASEALAVEAERAGIDASDVFEFVERMRAGLMLQWGQETMALMDRGALLAKRLAARG